MTSQYQLPNGQRVAIDYDVCRNASIVSFTMENGRIVDAVYVPVWVVCADCGRRHDAQIRPSHECKEQRRANLRAAKGR